MLVSCAALWLAILVQSAAPAAADTASPSYWESLQPAEQNALVDYVDWGENWSFSYDEGGTYPEDAARSLASAMDNLAKTTADPEGLYMEESPFWRSIGMISGGDDLLPDFVAVPEAGIPLAFVVALGANVYVKLEGPPDFSQFSGPTTAEELCLDWAGPGWLPTQGLDCPPTQGPNLGQTDPNGSWDAMIGAPIGDGVNWGWQHQSIAFVDGADPDCGSWTSWELGVLYNKTGDQGGDCGPALDPGTYIVGRTSANDPWWTFGAWSDQSCEGGGVSEDGTYPISGYSCQEADPNAADSFDGPTASGFGAEIFKPDGIGDGANDFHPASGLIVDPSDLDGEPAGSSVTETPSTAENYNNHPSADAIKQALQQWLDNTSDPQQALDVQGTLNEVWGADPPPSLIDIPAPTPNELVTTYTAQLDLAGFSDYEVDYLDETSYDPFQSPNTVVTVSPSPGTRYDPTEAPHVVVQANPVTDPDPQQDPQSDPTGNPSPDPGSGVGGDSCTGSVCVYESPQTPSIQWPQIPAPCSVFPFGVPCYVADSVTSFDGSGSAPAFDIPVPTMIDSAGSVHVDLGDIDGYDMTGALLVARQLLLVGVVVGFLMWLWGRGSSSDGGSAGSNSGGDED